MSSGTETEIWSRSPAHALDEWVLQNLCEALWILGNYGCLPLFWQSWGLITHGALAVLRSVLSHAAVDFQRWESTHLSEKSFAWLPGEWPHVCGRGRATWGTGCPANTHMLTGHSGHAQWLGPFGSTSSILLTLPKHKTCRNVLYLTSSSTCQVWIKLPGCFKREEEREIYEWTDCVIIYPIDLETQSNYGSPESWKTWKVLWNGKRGYII